MGLVPNRNDVVLISSSWLFLFSQLNCHGNNKYGVLFIKCRMYDKLMSKRDLISRDRVFDTLREAKKSSLYLVQQLISFQFIKYSFK